MSITSDIRSYADSALEQGKQVLDQAQTQLTDVSEQANGFVTSLTSSVSGTATGITSTISNRATSTVGDLRAQAEKTVNLDALKSAVEPYLAQASGYRHSVTDLANGFYTNIYSTVRSDRRVARIVDTAEAVSGAVVGTVQDRVVKPVISLTRRSGAPARKPAASTNSSRSTAERGATRTTKPATTRPASAAKKSASAKKATAAAKTTTAKATAPAKKATTARRSPAKKPAPSA